MMDSFFREAKLRQYHLLKEDKGFIREMIMAVPISKARPWLMNYLNDWQKGFMMEKNNIKKENSGRRYANEQLRLTYDFFREQSNGA